jgi:2-(1,2-epoxy-1,2-dihydrophenyl)acetyl-CoA isomerase
MEAAIARARGLAAGPTAAYGLLKRALNHSLGMPLEDQLEVESHLQQVAARTADFQEGIRAFAEKRKPVFTGR